MQLLDDGGKRHVVERDEFVTSVDLPAAWVEPGIARGVADKRVGAEADRQRVARGVPDKAISPDAGSDDGNGSQEPVFL
jgi:hypothetical protein